MFKKLLACVCTAAICVSMLAGCGSASGTATTAAGTTAAGTTKTGATTAGAAKTSAAAAATKAAIAAETLKTAATGAKKDRKDLKIGVSWKTLQEERWVTELDEIKKVCEEEGITMLYQCSENDSQKQVGQIENLISQGIDILICMAPEKGAVNNVLKQAHDAGVFVCYYEQVGGEAYFDMSGGNDYYEVGQAITKTIGDMKITGDVCYLLGDSAGGSGVINFKNGMYDGMKDCKVNVVGEQFVTNWDPATGMGYVENWLSKYKDSLTAVLCMNDGLAGGAVKALTNAGLAGKVLVCGQDCDLEACQRIVAGTQVSTIRKGGRDYARKFTETAIKYYLGEMKESDFTMTDKNSLGEDKPFMSYPAIIVTKDNIDKTVIDAGVYTHEQVYGK